jgi:hypothetical protein
MSQLACWLDWLDAHNGAVTAVATIFIAFFTIALAVVSWRQARLIKQQIVLGTDEFRATHRPRLRIRSIAFDWQRTPDAERPRVHFAIVNTGETTASEIELKVTTVLKYIDRWEVPIGRQVAEITPRLLSDIATGGNQGCYIERPESIGVLVGSLTKGTNLGIPVMYIAGNVTYKSKMGAGYSTFFVREFDHVQNSFKPSKDPEENYED